MVVADILRQRVIHFDDVDGEGVEAGAFFEEGEVGGIGTGVEAVDVGGLEGIEVRLAKNMARAEEERAGAMVQGGVDGLAGLECGEGEFIHARGSWLWRVVRWMATISAGGACRVER